MSRTHQGARIAAALAVLACAAVGASAQVLEVGRDGSVQVFDGPAVTTSAGVTRIAPPRPASRLHARKRPGDDRTDWTRLARAAQAEDLSPALIEAVAWSESRRRADAVSPAGALGEMQLMPGTARALRVDPARPDDNARGGARYLRALIGRYDGDLPRALAAYNAGPGAADRYGAAPPYRETRAYVAAVLDRLGQAALASGYGAPTEGKGR